MKASLRMAALTGLMVLLTGCTSTSDSGTEPSPPSPPQTIPQRVELSPGEIGGQNIRYLDSGEIKTLKVTDLRR